LGRQRGGTAAPGRTGVCSWRRCRCPHAGQPAHSRTHALHRHRAAGTPIEAFQSKFENGTLAAVAEAAGVPAANITGRAAASPAATPAPAAAGRRMLLQAAAGAASAAPDGAGGTVVTYSINTTNAQRVRDSLAAALKGAGAPFFDILARNGVPLRPGIELDGREVVAAGALKASDGPLPPAKRTSDGLTAAEITGIAISGGTSLIIVAILIGMLIKKYTRPRRYYEAKDIDPATVGQLRARYSAPSPALTATGAYSKAGSGGSPSSHGGAHGPMGGGTGRQQPSDDTDVAVGFRPYGMPGRGPHSPRDQDGGGYSWRLQQQQSQRGQQGLPLAEPGSPGSGVALNPLRAPPEAVRTGAGAGGRGGGRGGGGGGDGDGADAEAFGGLRSRGPYDQGGPALPPGAPRAVPLPPSPASHVHAVRFGSGLDFSTTATSNYSVLGSSMPGSRLLTAERVRQQALRQHGAGSPRASAAAAATAGEAAAAVAASRLGRRGDGGGGASGQPLLAADSFSSRDSFTAAEIQAGIEALAAGDDADSVAASDSMVPASWQAHGDGGGAAAPGEGAARGGAAAPAAVAQPWHRRLLGW
jgi:hypothetical protein